MHVYTPRSKLDLLVFVYTPRKTKVRFIILPNKQVQQETTFQMSDIFSLVCHAVSRVLCNHSNRGRFRNAHYLVTVSITQKSVPPLSKITLQFIVYLTVSNKYNCKFCFLCTFNMSLNTHFRCFTRFLSSLCFPVSNEHHGSFSTLSTSPSYSHHNSSHLPPQGSIHCHSGILAVGFRLSVYNWGNFELINFKSGTSSKFTLQKTWKFSQKTMTILRLLKLSM